MRESDILDCARAQAQRPAEFNKGRPRGSEYEAALAALGSNIEPADAELFDFLLAALRLGRAPHIDTLLALVPDEPLVEGDCSDKWVRKAKALRANYPGLQVDHSKREDMKYGDAPSGGGPLVEFVRVRIRHAKALWSRDILMENTKRQFRDWLKLHVDGRLWIDPLWPDNDFSNWSRSLHIVRVAFGLPPHFQTKPEWRRNAR